MTTGDFGYKRGEAITGEFKSVWPEGAWGNETLMGLW